jgi:hypothetical protein
MSADTTGKISKAEARTNWRRLRGMTDEEVHSAIIADPEAMPTDESFWKAAHVVTPQSKKTSRRPRTSITLTFRPDVHFDPQNDDAIIWGDEGDTHFRLVIRRSLLVRNYGLKKYFDRIGAELLIRRNRNRFEKVARDAYAIGASEVIIG